MMWLGQSVIDLPLRSMVALMASNSIYNLSDPNASWRLIKVQLS